ncbi:MAG: DinB family protein [Acidobacteria bacterium]|nr:DinB family protein [Acidobacteriota bacterium]
MKHTLFTLVALALPAFSQTTVKDALVKHWKVTGEFTLEVAKAMPAENYAFRPVPEEMTFGQLMAHIGAADVGTCAVVSGLPRPEEPSKIAAWRKDQKLDIDRDTAVEYLTTAFSFCNKAIESTSWEKLDAKVGNSQLTGFERFWSYFTHTAHHRGQAEVYLRLKGVKPPEYVF